MLRCLNDEDLQVIQRVFSELKLKAELSTAVGSPDVLVVDPSQFDLILIFNERVVKGDETKTAIKTDQHVVEESGFVGLTLDIH